MIFIVFLTLPVVVLHYLTLCTLFACLAFCICPPRPKTCFPLKKVFLLYICLLSSVLGSLFWEPWQKCKCMLINYILNNLTVLILSFTEAVWVGASSHSEFPIKWSTVLTRGNSGGPEYKMRTPEVHLASCAFHEPLSRQVSSRWEGGVSHTWLSSILLSWRG